ncbi:50S ribosomal protein L9 [candidate division KSB1 bacterium]|nr:MAG: 50S ribosomal protein L9 [candidate division KSB1 bacterium]
MQVILRKEFESLGKTGDVVSVKPGYARNFLVPRGIAYPMTKANLARLDHEKQVFAARDLRDRKRAGDLSAKLQGLRLIAAVQVGEEDRMFGSVTAADITELLKERNIEVDRRKIHLEEPIKHLGEFEVPIRLHRDVTVMITLDVIKTN